MKKKYINPKVSTMPLNDMTPLMAGSPRNGEWVVGGDDEVVGGQGAKPNMNPFAPDTDDDEQKKSIWE